MVEFSTDLAVNFKLYDGTTLNNVVLDWIEAAWGFYFAVMFGLVGGTLSKCANLIYAARMLGFYSIWTAIRTSPAFIEPKWIEQILALGTASVLTGTTVNLFNMNFLLEAFTVFSLLANYVIHVVDPFLRKHAGCNAAPGVPTEDFPSGVWEDCDDWKFAYAAVWIYAGFVYAMMGLAGCCALAVKNSKLMRRFGKQAAVAVVASSAGVTALRAIGRRAHSSDWFENAMFYAFFVFVAAFFVAQECLHRIKSGVGKCCCNLACLIAAIALPLYALEKMMDRVEKKILAVNNENKAAGAAEKEDLDFEEVDLNKDEGTTRL